MLTLLIAHLSLIYPIRAKQEQIILTIRNIYIFNNKVPSVYVAVSKPLLVKGYIRSHFILSILHEPLGSIHDSWWGGFLNIEHIILYVNIALGIMIFYFSGKLLTPHTLYLTWARKSFSPFSALAF